jgi:ABC-type antimicrobial peptide transport system permease subunit
MKDRSIPTPPKLPLKFLKWFCHPELVEDVEGDLSEIFAARYRLGKLKAKLLFGLDILLLLRPGIIRNIEPFNKKINYAMLSNYIKIARRNAMLYKGYTLLNLLGLITGITSSLLILLWVNDEVSVDKFHTNGEQIYQLFRNMNQSAGNVTTVPSIPKPASDLMRAEYPEIDQIALLSWSMDRGFGKGEKKVNEEGRFASPSFLEVFTFPLIIGDQSTALNDINSVVLSESLAEKHFGEQWRNQALGKTLLLEDKQEMVVTGVFEDIGTNSTLDFDWIMPATQFINENDWVEDWGNGSFSVYFTVDSEQKATIVADRIVNAIKDHTVGAGNAGDETLIINKFTDTYLYSNFENGKVNGGRIEYVRIMTLVAFLILMIACINFMNLTTARADRRSKEVGLRKAMGAQKASISIQFFIEAFIFATIAVVLSVLMAVLILPFFNQLVDKSLFFDFELLQTWGVFIGLIVGVGLISGSYPAFVLPAFNIIKSLKGGTNNTKGSAFVRKGLVVFQFSISILLIIGTTIIYQQLQFVLNKDIGLDKENLVDVRIESDSVQQIDAYKTELLKLAQVKAVSATSGNPVSYGRSTSSANWEGKDPAAGYEINVMLSDKDFIPTMGMKMTAGRSFSADFADSTNFIINEVAAQLMGFDNPVGKSLSFWGINGQIIGVVKNFHMRNLHEPIAPVIISCYDYSRSSNLMIRIQGDISQAIEQVEVVTNALYPGMGFQYRFADELLEKSYESEMTVNKLVNIFALISIIISCLGLFGLSAFTAEQRSKEVGVRKVLGSSELEIVLLLSKDYGKLIFIAFLVAIPFGYYITQDWLNNFEFRMAIQPQVFVYAGLISLLIGAITVSFKSYQAAVVSPVQSLKSD